MTLHSIVGTQFIDTNLPQGVRRARPRSHTPLYLDVPYLVSEGGDFLSFVSLPFDLLVSCSSNFRRDYITSSLIPMSVSRMAMGDNYPESTDGICPVCNSSMERGFIVSSGGIFWNDHVPSMICSGDSMGPHAKNIGGCSYIEALRCQKCSIIRYQFDIPINFERLERIRCPNCGEWDEYKKKEQDHELRSCPTCLYKF